MSKDIITTLRTLPQLHGSTLLAAQELAHRADAQSGVVTMSYAYLADKCHQSRRTAIRHIKRLLTLGIIRCQRFWQPGNKWGINRYQFLMQWRKPSPAGGGDRVQPKFPNPGYTQEKFGRVDDGKRAKEAAKTWLTPGSVAWRQAGLV